MQRDQSSGEEHQNWFLLILCALLTDTQRARDIDAAKVEHFHFVYYSSSMHFIQCPLSRIAAPFCVSSEVKKEGGEENVV